MKLLNPFAECASDFNFSNLILKIHQWKFLLMEIANQKNKVNVFSQIMDVYGSVLACDKRKKKWWILSIILFFFWHNFSFAFSFQSLECLWSEEKICWHLGPELLPVPTRLPETLCANLDGDTGSSSGLLTSLGRFAGFLPISSVWGGECCTNLKGTLKVFQCLSDSLKFRKSKHICHSLQGENLPAGI